MRKAAAFLAAPLVAALPAIATDLKEKLAPCLACHGVQGQSEIENVPSLGAQPAPYTVIQLFMFREQLWVAEPMNEMAKELGDNELQSIADMIAKQAAPKPPADPGTRSGSNALGRWLSKIIAMSAIAPTFPGGITCPGSQTSAKTIC